MAETEYERRLNQHEEDLREIYELLGAIRDRQTSMGGTLLSYKARIDQIESDLQGVNERLDGVVARLDAQAVTVAILAADVSSLKSDVASLKTGQDRIIELLTQQQ